MIKALPSAERGNMIQTAFEAVVVLWLECLRWRTYMVAKPRWKPGGIGPRHSEFILQHPESLKKSQ